MDIFSVFFLVLLAALPQANSLTPCTNTNYLERVEGDCSKFRACGAAGLFIMDCPPGLAFSESKQFCDYIAFVQECTTTCQNRCGSLLDASKPCQCNSACVRYNDCCADYATLCTASSTGRCMSLTAVSEELWASDVNRMSASDVTVNYQTKVSAGTTTDKSTQKLFTYVNEAKLGSGTYKLLSNLMNNYDPVKGARETATAAELAEDNAFLDAILATKVMEKLLNYLTCKGLVTSQSDLRGVLKRHWFDFYARSGSSTVPDTSGFEHIMVGEYKSGTTVNGFHNWVSFYEKEKAGSLNYFGYVSQAKPSIIGVYNFLFPQPSIIGVYFFLFSPAVHHRCLFFLVFPSRPS
ncbi:uridylate-specific endoribonuclease-like isoform X2 [Physella acuta]|uniref:uridylate-specific endoribonuclease-like isoform X2 n=1 Tax=Physella acuta TaxID=109671 RepID=UPI0027DC07A0|nr:uridylate-specific endoribonuclease-like isoform X2 [Physella acuta]